MKYIFKTNLSIEECKSEIKKVAIERTFINGINIYFKNAGLNYEFTDKSYYYKFKDNTFEISPIRLNRRGTYPILLGEFHKRNKYTEISTRFTYSFFTIFYSLFTLIWFLFIFLFLFSIVTGAALMSEKLTAIVFSTLFISAGIAMVYFEYWRWKRDKMNMYYMIKDNLQITEATAENL